MFHLGRVSFDVHSGLEYQFKNLVALRAGYSDVKQLTLGAGLRLPKLTIDYSFVKFDGQNQLGQHAPDFIDVYAGIRQVQAFL